MEMITFLTLCAHKMESLTPRTQCDCRSSTRVRLNKVPRDLFIPADDLYFFIELNWPQILKNSSYGGLDADKELLSNK